MENRSMKPVLSLTLAVLSSACAWTKFDDIENKATVRTYDVPESYRREGYGSVITTYQGKAGKREVSQLIASAGPDSPIVVTNVWVNGEFGDSDNIRCKKDKDCAKAQGVSATLVPFETWAPGTLQEHSGCIYAPGYENAYIFCETNPGSSPNFKLNLPGVDTFPATTWKFAGAAVPAGHPLGIALLGVYAVSNRTGVSSYGKLYYQPNFVTAAPPLREIKLFDPVTKDLFSNAADAGDLGYAVVAQANTHTGELVFAVSQPSFDDKHGRVIVGTYDPRIEPPATLVDPNDILNARIRTRACITSEDPMLKGVGKKLALGDINNDGNPELFVGIDPLDGQNGELQRLWMYPGTGLPAFDEASTVCPLWASDPVQVGCIDGIRGLDCEGTAFGASIAVGDVNGDKFGDLLVGAPNTNLQGKKKAGAAWLIPGSAEHPETSGLDFDNITNLYATNFEADGQAGTAVGFVTTDGRDEPVVGAPGQDAIHMFMCTDLETESVAKLCLPK